MVFTFIDLLEKEGFKILDIDQVEQKLNGEVVEQLEYINLLINRLMGDTSRYLLVDEDDLIVSVSSPIEDTDFDLQYFKLNESINKKYPTIYENVLVMSDYLEFLKEIEECDCCGNCRREC